MPNQVHATPGISKGIKESGSGLNSWAPIRDPCSLWSQLPTTARSFERMQRQDVLYKSGLVLDYNMNPAGPGAGSAIFIHIWRTSSKGTTGCIALGKEPLRGLARSLRSGLAPTALLLP